MRDKMTRKFGLKAVKFKYGILGILTSSIILLDQFTKDLVVQRFHLGESISIIPEFFSLTYIQNRGAAFGLLSTAHPSFRVPFFIVVPLIALVSIGYVFKKLPDRDTKMAVALSLVISGAFGNLLDRFRLGYVIDFLDFHWGWAYHFPAFNVADSAICVGVGLIMIDLLFQKEDQGENQPAFASSQSLSRNKKGL